jgi:hypothetical protein
MEIFLVFFLGFSHVTLVMLVPMQLEGGLVNNVGLKNVGVTMVSQTNENFGKKETFSLLSEQAHQLNLTHSHRSNYDIKSMM